MKVVAPTEARVRAPEKGLSELPVAVEEGTKAVISVDFSACGRRTFELSIRYERISQLKFPKKSFSTATPVSDKCILWQGQGSLSLFESGQDLFQDRSELFGVGFH